MKKIIILFLLFVFALPVNAASVIIENVKCSEVIEAIKKKYIKTGAAIDNVTDYSVTVIERGNYPLARLMYSLPVSKQIELKSVYSFVQDNKDVIINANLLLIQNPSSAFALDKPLRDEETQFILNNLKRELTGYYGYGFDYEMNIKTITITDVFKNNGLKKDDKIKKINNKSISGLRYDDVNKLLYPDEIKAVTLLIKPKKQDVKEITLDAYYIAPLIQKK